MLLTATPQPARSSWVAAPPRKQLIVGMGDMLASNDASATVVTYSLGSCVGVAIYDPVAHAGGILHAMLPDSNINISRAQKQPFMFVDTGLPELFHAVYALGGAKPRLIVKIAGGAQFLDENKVFNIGERNTQCTLTMLERNGVKPAAAIIGGCDSRTFRLDLSNGKFTLDVPGKGVFPI